MVEFDCPYHGRKECLVSQDAIIELHIIASLLEKWLPEIVSVLRNEK